MIELTDANEYTPTVEELAKNTTIRDRRVVALTREERTRGIAKIKADALRAFADELESQERVSPDDAMTILAMRERADEIEQERTDD